MTAVPWEVECADCAGVGGSTAVLCESKLSKARRGSFPSHHHHPLPSSSQLMGPSRKTQAKPRPTLLPNREDECGFQALVFDRQRAFMAMEAVAMRDALLGSDVLIGKAKLNTSTDMLASVQIKDPYKDLEKDVVEPTLRHVDFAGLADACLRWASRLPPVKPFAPHHEEQACHRDCHCTGKLTNKDIIGIIKAQHKPDWQPFLDFAEGQRASGRVKDKSAQELRLHLESRLNKLNDKFFAILRDRLQIIGYPHQSILSYTDEQALYPLVLKVKPLPPEVSADLISGDPFSYGTLQLEKLYECGKDMSHSFSSLRLEIGAELLKRAAKHQGKALTAVLREAERQWWYVQNNGDLSSIVALENWTSILTTQEK